jgi:hypothetical protein
MGDPLASVSMAVQVPRELTTVVSEEDLWPGAETLGAMDLSETPGSRVPVDANELEVERSL